MNPNLEVYKVCFRKLTRFLDLLPVRSQSKSSQLAAGRLGPSRPLRDTNKKQIRTIS